MSTEWNLGVPTAAEIKCDAPKAHEFCKSSSAGACVDSTRASHLDDGGDRGDEDFNCTASESNQLIMSSPHDRGTTQDRNVSALVTIDASGSSDSK